VNDVTPPTARLETRAARAGRPLVVRVGDSGSGVDPATIVATLDGKRRDVRLVGGTVQVATTDVAPGPHRLVLQVSDYQETRNTETTAAVLPNTRRLSAAVTIRP